MTRLVSIVTVAALIAGLCLEVLHVPALAVQASNIRFVNIAGEAGIRFKHQNGASPEKHLPETMGGGALFFDYNNDGWADIFLVNGGSFVNDRIARESRHALYRNNGDGTFADVTDNSGIGVSGFGMGGCAADFDNDGWVDLYVTSVGENKLYRNTGQGRFIDVTTKSGVGSPLWSSSCAFGDVDNDGSLDLYVANYVEFSAKDPKNCVSGKYRLYCHPNLYKSAPHVFYHNNGDGTFSDKTRDSGLYRTDGNGLGVVFDDYDNDGWIDIYVANDSVPNFLFHNKGKGIFEELGFRAGVAVGHNGKPLAGMGTDTGDIDGDGLVDIIVTNLAGEAHTLYRNLGKGLFEDATFQSGVGRATLPFVGFGVVFFDFDNDTDLDLGIANGDVIDNVRMVRDNASYEQPTLLLQNDGSGKFRNITTQAGPGLSLLKAHRGFAAADIDHDGDLDLLIGAVGQTPTLLRNDGGNRFNALMVRTVGTGSNRDGIGARLTLTAGTSRILRTIKSGSSYLAQNEMRAHFGLGSATRATRLEIRWPSGVVDILENVEANRSITVREGHGLIETANFAK